MTAPSSGGLPDRARREGARGSGLWPASGPLWWAPWVIAALAFLVRVLPVHEVFVKQRVLFIENDAYYHLRRIFFSLHSFPSSLRHDPYLAFPEGATAIWPPFLDSAIAFVLRPFFVAGEPRRLEAWLVWLPPLFGAATVLVAYAIAHRAFGRTVALVSALVLSVLSAHFWYSQISFLDHHCVVSLLSTILLALTMDFIRRASHDDWRPVRAGAWLGLVAVLALLVWPGAILYIALAELGVAQALWMQRGPEGSRRVLQGAAACNAVVLVVILPFSAFNEWSQWGEFSPVVLSHFQPWAFSLLTVSMLAGLAVSRRSGAVVSGARLAIITGMVALGLGVVSFVLLPELRVAWVDASDWLGKRDAFQAMVGESRPLFNMHGVFTTRIAELRLSRFVYLFPLFVSWMAWRARKGAPEVVFLAVWGSVLFVLTLLQKRFFNTSSVSLAIVLGWSCVVGFDVLSSRVRPRLGAAARVLSILLVGSIVFGLMLPTFSAYDLSARNFLAALLGERVAIDQRVLRQLERQEMAEWLRENTPRTSGLYARDARPEYGVLARWGEGHFIQYVAERPAVVGNFGDDVGREQFLRARLFYESEPEQAAAILEALRVRYLVVRAWLEKRPMAMKLWSGNGSGLGRYRLVFEGASLDGGRGAAYKVFEFVKGAELVGRAEPGQRVDVVLDLESNLARTLRFESSAVSDSSGEYRVRLPYANHGHPEAVRPASAYRVVAEGRESRVSLDELQVVEGAEVAGPSF